MVFQSLQKDGVFRVKRQVCLIPGDGIGPEVTEATCQILQESGAEIEWIRLPAGESALEEYGDVLPAQTVEAIAREGIALKGPITTPVGKGFSSVNVRLRKELNLYAAVRPVRSMEGIRTRYEKVEIVVIRENTEGLYSGLENEIVPGVVTSLKVVSEAASLRIARFAFEYALDRGRRKVTVFHKANIMKKSDGLFLECARRMHQQIAPEIEYEELIIDNGCMQLIRDPSRFDILLLENLYGDVVSDLCAGLVGGLGVVPGANIGDNCAVFEPVHGSAPGIAGKGIANPLACLMSGVMMLNYLGQTRIAERIKSAYNAVLSEQKPTCLTPDIGGQGYTRLFTEAIIANLR